jgi:hypothetical protein
MDPPQHVYYQDPRSLLVLTSNGKLKQLYVPIRVQNVSPLGNIPANTRMFVDEIQSHKKYRIIYRIMDTWYPYWHFTL